MTLEEDLLALEERFWLEGTAGFYRDHLAPDAVMVFPEPFGILDEEAIVASVGDEPNWAEVSLGEVKAVRLGAAAALLAYRAEARGRTGDRNTTYAASVYIAHDGAWKLAFHQQTPIGE